MPICVSCALGESHSPCPLRVLTERPDPVSSTQESFNKLVQQRLADIPTGVAPSGCADVPWDGAMPGDTTTGYEYHTSCIKCHNLLAVQNLLSHYCADQDIFEYLNSIADQRPKLIVSTPAGKPNPFKRLWDNATPKETTADRCPKCLEWITVSVMRGGYVVQEPCDASLHKCTSRVCTKCGLLVFLGEHNCARDNL